MNALRALSATVLAASALVVASCGDTGTATSVEKSCVNAGVAEMAGMFRTGGYSMARAVVESIGEPVLTRTFLGEMVYTEVVLDQVSMLAGPELASPLTALVLGGKADNVETSVEPVTIGEGADVYLYIREIPGAGSVIDDAYQVIDGRVILAGPCQKPGDAAAEKVTVSADFFADGATRTEQITVASVDEDVFESFIVGKGSPPS